MPTIQQLREQRETHWNAMKEINDRADGEGRAPSGEELSSYANAEKKFDELDAEIDRLERFANRKTKLEVVDRTGAIRPVEDDDVDEDALGKQYLNAFQSFVVNGISGMEPDERKALRAGFVPAKKGDSIVNAAGIGTTTAGGYLVPQGFRKDMVEKMKAYGSVMSVCQVIDTATGAVLPWPTNDDTGNVGALVAENTAVTEQDFTFGTAQLGAYKYTSKMVRISLEFLQDVDWVDAQSFVQRKFAERLGRIHNQHATTGTGSSQPTGIVTGATSGVTAAAVAAFTADELIDLQHSIDPAYRNERSKFMLSDTALKQARKLKDGQGRYLFQTNTSGDVPSLLAGAPYVINQDMAVPATGVKSVLYGDFYTGYVMRLVKAFELIRLDERYAEFGQVAFLGFDRMDGTVQDNSAYKALTQA
jgi:HK97 family phage major capsid protein